MTPNPESLSAFAWYWNRLRCMSPAELGYRLRRKLVASLQRFGLATLRAVPAPDLSVSASDFIGAGSGILSRPYIDAADEILQGKLRVFALDHASGPIPQWNQDPKTGTAAPLLFAQTLDYRNEALVGDIKYLWEPNRHLHLVTLAQAYRLTGDRRYLDGLRGQLESWFDQCPYLKGPNWTSALELAIRLINWSIAWQFIGGLGSVLFAGKEGGRFRDRWLGVVYRHLHFIREHFSRFSSANNHLIGEAAGLFIGAVTWPYWRQSQGWAAEAQDMLEREALLQNAPDGVNREQAVSYQQFVLDFLLLAALAGRANHRDFSSQYWKRIQTMLEFLASIIDVGGHVPMIGDADDGYVMRLSQEPDFCPFHSLLATGAVLFGRGDFGAKAGALDDKTRWLLGARAEPDFLALRPMRSTLPVRRAFPEGGYYVLGGDFETEDEIRLIADAGPLGYLSIAAHGHADALALTLSVAGREFLIDPGTYAYHSNRAWRDYFRGTSAHNTVVVDGQNQSVIGGNFMWRRKADAVCEAWEPGPEVDRFVGRHDGYRRFADPVVHRREILMIKPERRLVVNDTLECRGRHAVECYWHFSEACQVSAAGRIITATNNGITVTLALPDARTDFELRMGSAAPPGGWVSRRFDVKVPSTTVVARFEIDGTAMLATEIVCGQAREGRDQK